MKLLFGEVDDLEKEVVTHDGIKIGLLRRFSDKETTWFFDASEVDSDPYYSGENLHAIATKLDELNGESR